MQSKTDDPRSGGPAETRVETGGEDHGDPREPVQSISAEDLGLDQVFEILKNQRRRYVLRYLRDRSEPVSLSDLSEQIAAWENDKEVRSITSSERKRVYVGLYQCHLPKMDGMGVVSFNKPRAMVEPGEHIDHFYPYLDTPNQPEGRAWPKYYLGLSIASVLALVGGIAAQMTTSAPVTAAVSGGCVLAFAATALVHHKAGQPSADD